MKIISLEAANIKRLKAVEITPNDPMVVLAGKNKQGKTSILDAIWWALGGTANIQAKPIRNGEKAAVIRLALGDKEPELLVERRFTEKGEYLYVRNPDGSKHGNPQQILDKIIGHLAFDPVSFMREKPADQEKTLRRLVPLLDEKGKPLNVTVLDAQRTAAYTDRTTHNRDHKIAQARAEAIAVPEGLPDDAPDISALVTELSEVGAFNLAIDRERRRREDQQASIAADERYLENIAAEIADWEDKIRDAQERMKATVAKIKTATGDLEALPELDDPKDAATVQAKIDEARKIEAGIAARRQKGELEGEAEGYKALADACTTTIDKIDQQKADAVARAKMPVDGLSFGDGMVAFNDLPLEQASDAEQLAVSVAIAAAMNPKLRIMRVRDGSILDSVAMAALKQFGQDHDYQIWIEVVDESGEVGVVIEDGTVRGQELTPDAVLNKGKAAEAEPDAPASASAEPPRDERQKAAATFLQTALDELAAITKTDPEGPAKVNKLHGTVKAKLKNFPDLISQSWNPAKLAHEAGLQPKKVRE
jgi:hypothetical protein